MAKIFQVKTCKETDTGYRVSGVVGKNENGDDIAHADYFGSGGLMHHPEENEVASLVSLESGRFHIILGNKTTSIQLEPGESAFFSLKDGAVQGCIKTKADGEIHLNGDSYHATLFEPLEHFLNTLKNWLNYHTHPLPKGTSGFPNSSFNTDVSNAKSKKVKLS